VAGVAGKPSWLNKIRVELPLFLSSHLFMKTNLTQAQSSLEGGKLRAQQRTEPPSVSHMKRIMVKDRHKLYFIKVDDIIYFDANGNYITLHTLQRTYMLYESLTQLEQRLDPSDFTRINRSYLINLNYVEELESYFNGEYLVKLTGGHTLKWTRCYRENAKAFLTKNQ
jgi:two-component system LytT family response regulator